MKTTTRCFWCMAFAIAMVAGESRADSIRCGDQLASTGASLYEVRMSCGEPDAAIRRVEQRAVVHRLPGPCVTYQGRTVCGGSSVSSVVEIVVDEWTYDFGKDRFIHFVNFENGRLTTVRSGGYGKKTTS